MRVHLYGLGFGGQLDVRRDQSLAQTEITWHKTEVCGFPGGSNVTAHIFMTWSASFSINISLERWVKTFIEVSIRVIKMSISFFKLYAKASGDAAEITLILL